MFKQICFKQFLPLFSNFDLDIGILRVKIYKKYQFLFGKYYCISDGTQLLFYSGNSTYYPRTAMPRRMHLNPLYQSYGGCGTSCQLWYGHYLSPIVLKPVSDLLCENSSSIQNLLQGSSTSHLAARSSNWIVKAVAFRVLSSGEERTFVTSLQLVRLRSFVLILHYIIYFALMYYIVCTLLRNLILKINLKKFFFVINISKPCYSELIFVILLYVKGHFIRVCIKIKCK